MNHPPKQLALLISLIGGGLSPQAQAHIQAQRNDLVPALADIACTELDAASSPVCTAPASRDLVWQPQRSALDLGATAGVLVLYGARDDDWAPGESHGAPSAADASTPSIPVTAGSTADAVVDAPPAPAARPQSGKPHRVRVLARAALAQFTAFAKEGAQPFERIEKIERESLPTTRTPADPSAGSVEVERLLTNLATVLNDPRPAPPAVAERHADTVLRHLGAILSDERDEVGAIRPETLRPAPVSQVDKVLDALGEFASPPAQTAVEDGPARRLRKLAARAAKASAQPQAAEGGVDVLLPLEPPAAAPRAPRPNPLGGKTVAIGEGSLDRVRGGYAGEGLNISFGIERAVYINGSLATTTSLNVTDLGQITAGRGTAVLDTGTIALVQSGAGNSVAGASISSSAMGTIVQNTLDGQKIQNVTVINATANSLGLFRTMNLQSSLRGAVIDSLRR